ncbi:104_t:CDS:2 [Scutellospora calospora]|uniref:104_t:CDS:1 n=1 Tax=Scutellospora calospora TaxID=85575 RepID=A0ACA9KV52_9GLOM|nr:104_t:CDS:2 [Scutellospora calospora]
MLHWLILCISLWTVTETWALYDNNGPVIILSEKNWADEVLMTEKVVVVEFFAPWCGHCKNLAPEYKKAAENLKGLVKLTAVDCDDEANRRICSTYDVKGFPTIKLFPSQGIEDKDNIGKVSKKPKDYNGARTAQAIVDYAISEIPSFVNSISSDISKKKSLTLDEFFAKSNDTISKVILFTNKDQTTPLYKALSCEFHNRLILGEVKEKESAIVEKFGINKFPKLFIIPKDSKDIIEFTDKFSYDTIFKFLDKYALPKRKLKEKEAPEPEPFDPEINEIQTQSQLEELCLSKPIGLCVFSFLIVEPEYPESVAEHSANLEILRNVKKKLYEQKSIDKKLSLRFFWFNALSKESKKLIKDFKLSDMFPNLMILNPNRKVYRPHLGPFDEEGIERFLNEIAKGRGSSYEYNFEVNMGEKDDEKKNEKIEKKEEEEKIEKKEEKKIEKDEKKIEEKEEKKCETDGQEKDGVCSGDIHKTTSDKSDEEDKPKDHDEL